MAAPENNAGTFVADALTKSGILDLDTAQAYGSLFSRFAKQHSKKIALEWHKIAQPAIVGWDTIEKCPDDEKLRQSLLEKIAIVKLNGGLGTTMGCKGPKSAIPVRSGLTFLDLTVRQVEFLNQRHGVDIPLVLMNSFRTHEDTIKILNKYQHHNVTITCFTQSCFPRIDRDHYTPVPLAPFSPETQEKWYPPGHGDVYRALDRSGVLDSLLAQGKEYVFVSNVDNLGATLDLGIALHLLNHDVDFAMEVTDRTRGDVQGGVLIECEGKAKLLELAQVPLEHIPAFKSLKTFTAFNTNNLWVSLKAVKELLRVDAIAPPVIVSERAIPGLGSGSVLELETAAGGAIEFFRNAVGIRVPRSRFLPVKSTSDLMAVQSNLYDIRHGSLVMSPAREVPFPPVIKLGPEFAELEAYAERFEEGIPDMLELDHLTVSGNVHFSKDCVLRGTVIVVAELGCRIDLPQGSVLENKVITGNLRILEH